MATVQKEKIESDDPLDLLAIKNWNRDYLTMPGNRVIDRPPFKDFAIPFKEAGKGSDWGKKWERKRLQSKTKARKPLVMEEFRDLEALAEFIGTTNLKSQLACLDRHVEVGLKAADQDLEVRRNKLRSLLLSEEAKYTREYIEKSQKLAEQIYEQKKNLVNEILKTQEQERKDEVREKLEQLARDNCENLRIQKSNILNREAAAVQRQQICENLMYKGLEYENDKFWIEIWKKLDEEKIRIEEEDERVRLTKIREVKDDLRKQIIGKELQKEEIKWLRKQEAELIQKMSERINEEKQIEKEAKLQEKRELKKVMDAQLEAERSLKAKKQQEELEYDKLFAEQLERMIFNEKLAQRDERAQERMESEYFRAQMKELKDAQKEKEKRVELLRQEEADKKEAAVRKNIHIQTCAREKLNREVMETRAQQILDKRKALEREKEAEESAYSWSEYMLEKNRKLDKQRDKHKVRDERKIAFALEDQQKYGWICNERRKKEDEELLSDLKSKQLASDELVRSFRPNFGEGHPFSKKLREQEKQN